MRLLKTIANLQFNTCLCVFVISLHDIIHYIFDVHSSESVGTLRNERRRRRSSFVHLPCGDKKPRLHVECACVHVVRERGVCTYTTEHSSIFGCFWHETAWNSALWDYSPTYKVYYAECERVARRWLGKQISILRVDLICVRARIGANMNSPRTMHAHITHSSTFSVLTISARRTVIRRLVARRYVSIIRSVCIFTCKENREYVFGY